MTVASNQIPRVVYDCMIFLQAAAQPQRVHTTMRLVHDRQVTLCMSADIVDEIRDVLTRPELTAKFPALNAKHVDSFLNDILSKAELVQNVPRLFALPRDPKDEPYINLAIAASARFLVTWNERHLTYLMRKDTLKESTFAEDFRKSAFLIHTHSSAKFRAHRRKYRTTLFSIPHANPLRFSTPWPT